MKIVIQYDEPCPFLYALYGTLSSIGNHVVLWNSQISFYQMAQEIEPDIYILYEDTINKYHNLIKDKTYITYGNNDPIGNGRIILQKFNNNISFADIINYKDTAEDYELYTDILVSSNFFNKNSKTLLYIDNIFNNTDYKIKCAGNQQIPSVFYVGMTNDQEFMRLAKSSKVVIASNTIERDSLIYRKVCSYTIDEELPKNIVRDEPLRRKITKDKRKNIIDNNKTSAHITMKILNSIGLTLESNKIESILGNIL